MKCTKCSANLKIPANLVGKTVKCRCGHVLKAVAPEKAPKRDSTKIKVHCGNCNRSLNVHASAAGKAVKCPCGHRFTVPRQIADKPVLSQSSFTDEIDFSALSNAELQSGQVKKGPSYLTATSDVSEIPEAKRGKATASKNYASGMLSEVSSEFADKAATQTSDAKRRKFLLSMSILFACLLIPPIIFVVYRSINAASEGYANWGDRVQETVVSMKLQTADPKDRAGDISEITSKRAVGLPKQPTPGQALTVPKDEQYSTDADVRIMLERYYPGWVCDKIELEVNGKLFRATMKYAPPPIDLPPTQDYAIGSKEEALAAVINADLQTTPNDAVTVFQEAGFISGELECTEIDRLPGKITLRCTIKSVRDIVPDRSYPGMMATIDQLQATTFQIVLDVDDSMTAKEKKPTDNQSYQDLNDGDLTEVVAEYDADPSKALLKAFIEELSSIKISALLN